MNTSIIGALGLDTIETPNKNYHNVLGGSAAYASIAASIFSKPKILSIAGKDFPQSHFDLLKNHGIDLDNVSISQKPSFKWKAKYGKDYWEERITLSTEMNALEDFTEILPDAHKNITHVLCTNIHPLLQKKLIKQFNKTKIIVLDTISYWIEHYREDLLAVLKYTDVLIINEEELKLITKTNDTLTGIEKALFLGPKRVIVKKGQHGVIMHNGDSLFLAPAFPVNSVLDPTGAGDSFAGAFLGYLSQFKELSEDNYRKAVIMGILIASYAIQDFSVNRLSMLNKIELDKLYLKYRNITSIGD